MPATAPRKRTGKAKPPAVVNPWTGYAVVEINKATGFAVGEFVEGEAHRADPCVKTPPRLFADPILAERYARLVGPGAHVVKVHLVKAAGE